MNTTHKIQCGLYVFLQTLTLWLSHFEASNDDTMIRTKQKYCAMCVRAQTENGDEGNKMNNAESEALVYALIFLAGVKNMAPILQTIVCWGRAHTENEPTFNPEYTHPHKHTLHFYANAITNYIHTLVCVSFSIELIYINL